MPAFTLSVTIEAPINRVWRALCDPTEVVQWDSTVVEALDAPPDYPQPGQHVRWRLRDSTALLHDRPQHVEPPTRLHSNLAIGRDHLDETYALAVLDPNTTQLDCHVAVRCTLPVLGPLIARLRTLPETRAAFQTSLHNLKHHCKTNPETSARHN
jgi:uncharacterized protein YndB with AHSA1/START domain